MSLLGNVVGHGIAGVGRSIDYLTPGAGAGRLTNVGRAVYDPNMVLSNPAGIISRAPAFTPVINGGAGGHTLPATTDRPSGPFDTPYTGAGGASTVDPQAEAYYGDQIGLLKQQLGGLDPQYNVGRDNIQNAYNSQYNQLNDAKARNERDYTTSRGQTIQDQQTAKQNIDTGVRQNTNALQRLLGRSGSGNSSAAQVLAPYAAGRAGSQQRSQVQQQYGRNLQALDTNWQDTLGQYTNSFSDLDRQRFTQMNDLERSVNDTRSNLQTTLAGLATQQAQARGQNYAQARTAGQPYLNEVQALQSRIADLSRQYQNPVLQAAPVNYAAPSLGSYNTDRPAIQTPDQPAYQDQVNPYGFLFGDKRRQGLI